MNEEKNNDKEMSADRDPSLVFKTWQRSEAEMIKAILEEHGIHCMLTSDITHAVYPFSVDGLGEIRIYVPQEEAKEARDIIQAYSKEEEKSGEKENDPEP